MPLALIAGFTLLYRRHTWISVWLVAFPIVASLFYPNSSSHFRYLIPTLPWVFVLSVYGIERLALRYNASTALIISAILLSSTATLLIPKSVTLGNNIKNIEEIQACIGRSCREQLGQSTVVASDDIGAIAYFGRVKVIAIQALIHKRIEFKSIVCDSLPQIIALWGEWHEQDIQSDWFTSRYGFITSVESLPNTVCPDSKMLMFRRK
jgi:hypothetical protein